MKKILYSLALLAATAMCAVSLSSCSSDDDPFATASPGDDPRIVDPTFPDRVNGELPVFATISRDQNFKSMVIVTPVDYTTCTWFIDGDKVAEGTEIDYSLKAGTYTLRLVAETTEGKSTYREALVEVKPLADDPALTTRGTERIVGKGCVATLYGKNLGKVKAIVIGDQTVGEADIEAGTDNDGNEYINYLVPDNIAEGEYRIVLKDAEGGEYGGDKIQVSGLSIVTAGAARANGGADWTLSGINLDKVASVTVGDQTVTAFKSQSESELTLTCPSLADGDYTLSAKTKDGKEVQFSGADGFTSTTTVTVSSERTLWEGHHYVSWDLPDGSPNKTFNLIATDVFAQLKAGAVLKIDYSVEPSAEYHQLKVATGWWTDLRDKIEFSEGGTYEMTLTQDDLDKIQQQAGFLCVGHGYYVDRVSVK